MVSAIDNVEEYIASYRPIGTWVLVRKCARGKVLKDGSRGIEVGGGKTLAFPSAYAEKTNWCELIAVGDKCKAIRREYTRRFRGEEGYKVWVPDGISQDIQCLDHELFEYWAVKEEKIPTFLYVDGKIYPLSNMLVCQTRVSESAGDLVKPFQRVETEELTATTMTVIAVAEDVDRIKVGDVVTAKRHGHSFSIDGSVLVCVKVEDVEAIHE